MVQQLWKTTFLWRSRPRLLVSRYSLKHIFNIFIRFRRSHGEGVFGHRERSFSKTLSVVNIFKKAVFLLSWCGRVKTKLFENPDVTGSIYNPSEHTLISLGITLGHVVYLFSLNTARADTSHDSLGGRKTKIFRR